MYLTYIIVPATQHYEHNQTFIHSYLLFSTLFTVFSFSQHYPETAAFTAYNRPTHKHILYVYNNVKNKNLDTIQSQRHEFFLPYITSLFLHIRLIYAFSIPSSLNRPSLCSGKSSNFSSGFSAVVTSLDFVLSVGSLGNIFIRIT